MTYKALGFWTEANKVCVLARRRRQHEGSPDEWRADPVKLARLAVQSDPDPDVITYLRSGKVFEVWRGYSHCRFRCGVSATKMGDRDLTDGVWIWPEGLVHYVEAHHVPLPAEFVATAQAHHGEVPETVIDRTRPIDRAFWNDWYDRQTGVA